MICFKCWIRLSFFHIMRLNANANMWWYKTAQKCATFRRKARWFLVKITLQNELAWACSPTEACAKRSCRALHADRFFSIANPRWFSPQNVKFPVKWYPLKGLQLPTFLYHAYQTEANRGNSLFNCKVFLVPNLQRSSLKNLTISTWTSKLGFGHEMLDLILRHKLSAWKPC